MTSSFGAGIERLLAFGALLAVPIIAPLRNVRWAAPWAWLTLLGAGVLLCALLFGRVLGPLRLLLVETGHRVQLGAMLSVGALAQILMAAVTMPTLVSDFAHYSYLAEQLATRFTYVDEIGRRAQWPPGWPLTYAPFVWLFGPTLLATTLANVLLYLGGAYATWSLASRLGGRCGAGIAILLFTFWPSRLLLAGLAAKENLLIALVISATALAFKALDPATRRPVATALCAGIAFGAAALTQPGLLFLLVVVPMCYRFAIAEVGSRRFVAYLAAGLAGAAIATGPSMARNCIVFDGAFCGISANGGSVFYRANNASATGFYTTERGTPLKGLSEVEQNRLGYALGRQWIASYPLDAAKLSLRKVAGYLGSDDYGAYWSVLRGPGGSERDALGAASTGRLALYRVASFVSLVYWVALAGLCVQAIRSWPSPDSRVGAMLPPLVYPLLGGAAVFGIFESGDRQHMFAVGPLIILAAAGISQGGRGPARANDGAARGR